MNNQDSPDQPLVIVVMGVSGCGKSTVAEELAKQLDAHFKDGDELHPSANIQKMESGIPLSDADREPWLIDVATYARQQAEQSGICVIACSALKYRYRKVLNEAGNVIYVYLAGSYELIASRMHARTGHFMPENLLDSQFEALEDPTEEPNVVSVGIEKAPHEIAVDAVQALKKHSSLH